MRELFADVFLSVDGHALGTRSPGYFGYFGPDLERWIHDEQARPHRDVMGRKTYEMLADLPEEHRDDSWNITSEKPILVFSRTLTSAEWPGVELSALDAVDEVRRLRQSADRDLRTVGSLSLVQQLLNAGLVDHLRLMVFPLVIGETGERPPESTRSAPMRPGFRWATLSGATRRSARGTTHGLRTSRCRAGALGARVGSRCRGTTTTPRSPS